MGSLLSTEGDELKYTKTLVRWHSQRAPRAISVYLVTSKAGFWSLAFEFQRTPGSDVHLDLRNFSGIMCIPQLLATRRLYMQVINWPCEQTIASFPFEGSTVQRLGDTSAVKTKIATNVADYDSCDLLACGLAMHIQDCFEKLCKQLHPNTEAPASTMIVTKQGKVHKVDWPASNFPSGHYWDEVLNDKSVIVAVLDGIVDLGDITYSNNLPVDLDMATLITKADILSITPK